MENLKNARVGKNAFMSDFSTVWKHRNEDIEPTTVTGAQIPDKLLEF